MPIILSVGNLHLEMKAVNQNEIIFNTCLLFIEKLDLKFKKCQLIRYKNKKMELNSQLRFI